MVYDIELRNVTKQFIGQGVKRVLAVDNVSLQIEDGEFFALLGPSGCGKTTTLRMIAGFEQPTSGEILLRGQPMQNVPPFHRPVNTVFQDYALFPHMTVLDNVMFGLRMANMARDTARERALAALEMVRLPDVADRKPRQLSGGQQQRVALARALVNEPTVLLLDEPLGALDLKLRKAMQYELKAMQQRLGITFIYVTHDQEEAMTMADRIAVMNHGQVLQIGTPEEIYERPASRFVADFIGETNFMGGKVAEVQGEYARIDIGQDTFVYAAVGENTLSSAQMITIGIRPEKVGLLPVEGQVLQSGGYNVEAVDVYQKVQARGNTTLVDGVIEEVLYIGTDTRYTISLTEEARLVARLQNFTHRYGDAFQVGQRVHVYWANEDARILTE